MAEGGEAEGRVLKGLAELRPWVKSRSYEVRSAAGCSRSPGGESTLPLPPARVILPPDPSHGHLIRMTFARVNSGGLAEGHFRHIRHNQHGQPHVEVKLCAQGDSAGILVECKNTLGPSPCYIVAEYNFQLGNI